MYANEAQNPKSKPGSVSEQIDRLSKLADALNSVTTLVGETVSPVLTIPAPRPPEPMATTAQMGAAAGAQICPVAEVLSGLAERLQKTLARLDDINSRIHL